MKCRKCGFETADKLFPAGNFPAIRWKENVCPECFGHTIHKANGDWHFCAPTCRRCKKDYLAKFGFLGKVIAFL